MAWASAATLKDNMTFREMSRNNPIYDACLADRLKDLIRSSKRMRTMLIKDYLYITEDEVKENWPKEGLKEGEFAIGNWIVRPRF